MSRQLSAQERQEIIDGIFRDSGPSKRFFFLMLAAATIATSGLLANSTPVVIAAMLVAPLTSSILGFSLASVTNNRQLAFKATQAILSGVIICILASVLLHRMLPSLELGSEIYNRTRPNLLDLIVATAAGLTGAYALVHPEITEVIPGVAIGVSLVPPLCASGVLLSSGEYANASGAFLLFVANVIAIHLSGVAIFALWGFGGLHSTQGFHALARRHIASIAVFTLMAAVLGNELFKMSLDQRVQSITRDVLSTQAKMVAGASLDRYTVTRRGRMVEVRAVIRTPFSFTPSMVRSIQSVLASRLGTDVALTIRSVLAKDATASKYVVYEVASTPTSDKDLVSKLDEVLRMQASIEPGMRLDAWELVMRDSRRTVVAHYSSEKPLDPTIKRGIQNVVRSIAGEDIDVLIDVVQSADSKTEHAAPPQFH